MRKWIAIVFGVAAICGLVLGFLTYPSKPPPIEETVPYNQPDGLEHESEQTRKLIGKGREALASANSIYGRIRDGGNGENIQQGLTYASEAVQCYRRAIKRAKYSRSLQRELLKAEEVLRRLEKLR